MEGAHLGGVAGLHNELRASLPKTPRTSNAFIIHHALHHVQSLSPPCPFGVHLKVVVTQLVPRLFALLVLRLLP